MSRVPDASQPSFTKGADPRPVRVLHILHTLARAGAEQLVYELATTNRDRLATAVLCLDREGPLADSLRQEGFQVFFTDRRDGMDFRQVGRIAKAIRAFEPDIVHCHQYTPFFYGALACAWLSAQRILFTEHGRHFPDTVSAKRRLFNRFLVRRAARITAVCEFTRRCLVRNEGLPASRIEVVYNGVDPGRFEGMADVAAARRRLSLPGDAPVVVQVGTFRQVKDQPTAIRAFALVRRRVPRAMLVFVGDGPDLPTCRDLAARMGLEDGVVFLGSRQDVPEILAAADVQLMTSLSEAHSVALLEGMAAGLAIVATDVGGIPETVVDGQTGLLAPPGDHERIASCLLALLADAEMRRRMGQAGRSRVLQRFQRKDMHRRYLEIYATMATGEGRG